MNSEGSTLPNSRRGPGRTAALLLRLFPLLLIAADPGQIVLPSGAQTPPDTRQAAKEATSSTLSRLRVGVDPRVELMSLVFRLAGNPEYNQAKVPSYEQNVEKAFARFRDHPAVQAAAALGQERGVSYDACMSLAVHLDESYELRPGISLARWPEGLDRRWTAESVTNFLALTRRFVRESAFEEFLRLHQELYQTTESRLRALVETKGHLDWFEGFFGERSPMRFTVVPALLNGGCCYGPHSCAADGRQEFFCVLGVWQTDPQGQPEFTPEMLDTVVHEFCHSYANPIIDRHAAELNDAGESLFQHVRDQMRSQAYGDAQTMLRESLVRACTVRYVQRYGGESVGDRAVRNEESRGFGWMKDLSGLLAQYETNRGQYPRLETFSPRLVAFFTDYAQNFGKVQAALDAKRPKVLSVVPADGATGVDPSLGTITVVFDRPMKDRSWALVGGGPHHPKTTGSPHYDERRTTWTVPIELKPDWDYEFRLNYGKFDSFRSEEGVPLKSVLVRFRTAEVKL